MIEQTPSTTEVAHVLTLTEIAANQVRDLLQKENDPMLGLRIFVAGGGCSGLQYGMTLDGEQKGDIVIAQNDFRIFVDEESMRYLDRCEIDYVKSLMGAGFVVNNPNAVSTCGCGQSFRTANTTDDDQPRKCTEL